MCVCVFGSLSRLAKGFIFFLFMCMCVCINSWRPEMDTESPAARGTGTCELPHTGAGSCTPVLCKISNTRSSVDVRVLGSTSWHTALLSLIPRALQK